VRPADVQEAIAQVTREHERGWSATALERDARINLLLEGRADALYYELRTLNCGALGGQQVVSAILAMDNTSVLSYLTDARLRAKAHAQEYVAQRTCSLPSEPLYVHEVPDSFSQRERGALEGASRDGNFNESN
jgi:methylglyoxal synthase